MHGSASQQCCNTVINENNHIVKLIAASKQVQVKMLKKGLSIFVAVFGIFSGVIWYNAYLPISPKLTGSDKLMPFFFNVNSLLSKIIGEKLGIVPRYKVFRWVFNTALSIDFLGNVEDTTKGVTIKDSAISGVPVKIFRPHQDEGPEVEGQHHPGLIFIHGGGLVFGTVNWTGYIYQCIILAQRTKSVVISVEYRLAPEHAFPAQFEDCYAVVHAVASEPSRFGITKNKIALIGDSAGGMLSAAISLEFAKQNRSSELVAQVLIYPWLQLIDMLCMPSFQENKRGFQMDEEQVAYFMSVVTVGNGDMQQAYLVGNVTRYFMKTPQWKFLEIPNSSNCDIFAEGHAELPHFFVETALNPRLSPLLADSLEGSPPTLAVIAEYDIIASEGIQYAKRLEFTGVLVVSKMYRSYHGFLVNMAMPFMNATIANQAMEDIVNFLNSAFYTKL